MCAQVIVGICLAMVNAVKVYGKRLQQTSYSLSANGLQCKFYSVKLPT